MSHLNGRVELLLSDHVVVHTKPSTRLKGNSPSFGKSGPPATRPFSKQLCHLRAVD